MENPYKPVEVKGYPARAQPSDDPSKYSMFTGTFRADRAVAG